MADDTVVVFTSDHGDLVGAHGGLMQKWYNAYDEAIRVPLLVRGPGIVGDTGGVHTPTSHVDLLPTLLGLAGIDVERAAAIVAVEHDETQPLPGPRPQPGVAGRGGGRHVGRAPVLHDRGRRRPRPVPTSMVSGQHVRARAVPLARRVGDHVAADRRRRRRRVWKLNHYYERLDEFDQAHGVADEPVRPPAGRSRRGSCTT